MTFEKLRVGTLPVYRAQLLEGSDKFEVLTRQDIVAELRIVTGIALNERGNNPLPPPLPRVSCRFEKYSAVDHEWMRQLIDWTQNEADHLGLGYRKESWDCDDFSLLVNAAGDLASLKARVDCPPQLIGRLVVQQVSAWGEVKAGGAHELIIFRSGRSWWVAEPQNGIMASLWNYPNRRHVREILFN